MQAWLSHRISVYRSLMIGMVTIVVGIALCATLINPDTPFWLVYIAWGIGGIGMGMTFNTVVSAAMNFTPEGKEGATSTANGIAGSLSIGLAAGLGGAIANHVQFFGGSLSDALGIIWLMAGVACLACFYIVVRRFSI